MVRVPVALGAGIGGAMRGERAQGGGAGARWAAGRARRWSWRAGCGRGVLGIGCVCVFGVCGVGIWRNKAGGAGVAYGTWIRRSGRRVAVRWWRRRVLAGRAAPASPFAEGRGLRTFCPMSARLLTGRLPNSHATVIAYGATVPRFSPLLLAPFYYTRYGGSRYKAINRGRFDMAVIKRYRYRSSYAYKY